MKILSFFMNKKTPIIIGVLLAYIGFVEYQNPSLQQVVTEQLNDINVLKTEVASEQSRSGLYEDQITDVNKKLRSVTLLLSESRGIITELENERIALNNELKQYEFELVTIKEATEFVNMAFKRASTALKQELELWI